MSEAATPETVDTPAAPTATNTSSGAEDLADAEAIDTETVDAEVVEAVPTVELTEEAVVALIAERDDYLDRLQRLKADFANARRRSDERAAAQRTQAAADLVEKLLPVLDSCDAALGQGVEAVKPVRDALLDVLASGGLSRVDPAGEPFDPQLHEAVLHEAGDGEQTVVETLRPGYSWNGKVLRPAMVKVQG